MNLFKKIAFSTLLLTLLLSTVQATANANTLSDNQSQSINNDLALTQNRSIPVKPGATMSLLRRERGMVKINSGTHAIYNSSVKPIGVYYYGGESFYYDSIYQYYYYTDSSYTFASYISSSGVRRYVLISSDTGLGSRPISGLTISKY